MPTAIQEFIDATANKLDLDAIQATIRSGRLTARDLLLCLIELKGDKRKIIELFKIEELQTIAMSEDNYVLRAAILEGQPEVFNILLQIDACTTSIKLDWILDAVETAQSKQQLDSMHLFFHMDTIKQLFVSCTPSEDESQRLSKILILAAKQGDSESIDAILTIPIIKNKVINDHGDKEPALLTAILNAAVTTNNTEVISKFIQIPQSKKHVLAKHEVLLWAIKNKHADIVKEFSTLIDNIAFYRKNKMTLNRMLIEAAKQDDIETVNVLCNIEAMRNTFLYNMQTERPWQPVDIILCVATIHSVDTIPLHEDLLYWAIENKRTEIIDKFFLYSSMNDNNIARMRALNLAIYNEKFDAMNMLLDLKPSKELTLDNYNFLLQNAIHWKNAAAVKRLLALDIVQELVAQEAESGNFKKLIDSIQSGNTEIAEAIYEIQLSKLILTDSLREVVKSAAKNNMLSIIQKLLTNKEVADEPIILEDAINDATKYKCCDVLLKLCETKYVTKHTELHDDIFRNAIKYNFTDLVKLYLKYDGIIEKLQKNTNDILELIYDAIRYHHNEIVLSYSKQN